MRTRRVPTPRPLATSLSRLSSALAVSAAIALANGSAHAQTRTWDNDNLDFLWNTATNWSGDTLPLSTDQVIFGNAGSAGTIQLQTAQTVNSILFNLNGFTLSDATQQNLTITSGNVIVNSGISATINSLIQGTNGLNLSGGGTVVLGGSNGFTGGININGSTLSFTNDNQLGGANVINLTNGGVLSQSASAAVTLGATHSINVGAGGGVIDVSLVNPGKLLLGTANQITGSGTLAKTGAGILQLTQSNSFTGAWNVNGGQVEVQSSGALGSGTVTVNNGGELVASNTAVGNAVVIGSSGATLSTDNGGSSAFTGNVSAGSNAFNVSLRDFYATGTGRNLTISGTITGTGGMNVVGPTTGTGSLLLAGNNTGYSGTITANSNSIVRAVEGATLDALGSSSITLSGGTLGFTPQLTGAGANAGLSGRYYNSALIGNGVIGGFDFGLSTVLATRNDATINFSDFNQTTQRPFGVGATNLGALWTGVLNITTGGSYTFSTSSDDGSLAYVDGQPIVLNDFSQGATLRSGTITLQPGFHSVVIKYGQGGGGTSMVANYSGPDTTNNSVLLGSVANSVTNSGSPILGSSTIDNSITLTAGTTSTVDLAATNITNTGTVTFGAGAGLTVTGLTGSELLTQSGAVTLNGANTITTGVNQVTNNVQNASAGADLTISSIGESVAGSSLTKAGPRTLTLTGSPGYTGLTTVAGGTLALNVSTSNSGLNSLGATISSSGGAAATLQIQTSEQIPDAAPIVINGANGQAATLNLNGFTETTGTISMTALDSATAAPAVISTGATGKLILTSDLTLNNNRNQTNNTGREVLITGTGTYTTAAPGTGTLDLGGVTRTITVNSSVTQPNTDATIETNIINGSLIKAGNQRLILGGNNSGLASGITVNSGVLRGVGANAAASTAFGSGALAINTGSTTAATIELRNNGAAINTAQGGTLGVGTIGQSVNNVVTYGNNANLSGSVGEVGFDVNNNVVVQNGATITGSGGTLALGTLTTNAAAQIDVTGGNNYSLRFNGLSLAGALTVKPTTGNLQLFNLGTAGANNIITAAGTSGSLFIGGSGTGFSGNVNVSAGGTLRLIPAVGAANDLFGSGTFTTASNPTIGISPTTAGGTLTAGTPGGLTARFYQFSAGPAINTTTAFASIPSGVLTVPLLSDGAIVNRPPTVTGTAFTNGVVVYSGLLNITTGGSYNFQSFVDDQSQLVIDGMPVISVNAGGGGTGIIHSPVSGGINLTAGLHTIAMKVVNGGGGGGIGLSYNGADSGNVMRPIPSTAFQSVAPLTNVANSGINQTIAAGASLTLDGGGTDLDGGINDLTFSGATGTLNVTNVGGIGITTVSGTTSFGANAPTFNPTTGVLGLIGDVSGSGTITKSGAGTLILKGVKSFSGALNITAGGVQITDPSSLGTTAGATVVSNTGVLDLNGVALGAEALTLNGTGIASVAPGALWNSSGSAASASGAITLASATTIGGLGDISLSGTITGAFNLTKIGPGSLIVTNANNTGTITVSTGVLKQAGASAIGANVTNVLISGGAVLDLAGSSISRPLNLTGAGLTNYGAMNTLGSLINTGASGVTVSGAVVLGGAASIGSSSLGTGGDYTISGVISGAQALTKVGGNTVTLTAADTNSGALAVNSGTLLFNSTGTMTAQSGLAINPTATVTLDNGTTAVATRLGAHSINLFGGNLNIIGNNGATAIAEAMGANTLTFTSHNSVLTLAPNLTSTSNAGVTLSTGNTISRGNNGTGVIRGDGLGNTPGNNIATVVSTNATPITTIGQGGAAGTSNRAIAPWLLADQSSTGVGTSFAAHVATNGIQVLGASDYGAANTIGANNNILLNGGATTAAPSGTTLVNSLTIDANANLTIGAGNSVNVDSGGILARSGSTSTISGAGTLNGFNTPFGFIPTIPTNAVTSREMIVWTPGTANLTISAPIGNLNPQLNTSGGLTKSGAGTLVLGASNFFTGSVRLNGGTTTLAGGENTILFPVSTPPAPGALTSAINGSNLIVDTGATLDLNGNSQRFAGYASNVAAGSSGLPGLGGGSIVNTSATTATLRVAESGTTTVASSIGGPGGNNLNFQRDGGNTLTMTAPNTYTGTTVINGGLTVLQDGATLSGTSSITINRAALRIDESALQSVANRISPTTPINLNGGSLAFVGRGGGTQNAWSVGTVTIGTGNALFQQTMVGNSNANSAGSAQLTIGNLVRGGAGSEVSFNFNLSGQAQSMGDNPRYFISQLNGGSLPAPGTMLPAWITVGGQNPASAAGGTSGALDIKANTTDFAQYDPATGLRPVLYTGTFAPGNNVNLGASTSLPVGGAVINSLHLDSAAVTVNFLQATDTLNLQSGGLLSTINGNNRSIGFVANSGNLTAGGVNPGAPQELFIYNGASTLSVNSRIINNPTDGSVVSPVFSSGGFGSTIQINGSNTYTGTTYVNGVILNLNAPSGGVAIPGDLVLSGNTSNGGDSQSVGNQTTRLLASNQIASTSNVTLNGGTLLDLNGFSNTINNLTFAADGGSNGNQGPGLQTGAGTLTLNGNVTATNLLQATTIPSMQGNLSLPTGAHTFNIGTVAGAPGQIGFQLNSIVSGAGSISKTGNGILGIGSLNTYTGATNIVAGSIQFTQANVGMPNSAVSLPAGTTLNAGGFNGTIGTLTGNGTVTSTVGGLVATASTSGSLISVPQVNVGADNGSSTFNGLVTGVVALGKVGTGTLMLSNTSNNYSGGTVLGGGTFQLAGAGVSTTGTGLMSVNNSATLTGSGLVEGGIQFNVGSAVSFALPASPGSAPIVTGLGSVSSTGLTTFNFSGTPAAGSYPLIDYGGSPISVLQMAGMKIGTAPTGGLFYSLVNNTAGTSIDLSVETAGAANTWTGVTNGTWDTSTSNWSGGAFSNGQQVTFNDNGVNKTITGGAVNPQGILVNNSANNNYSIANNIGGSLAAGLTKSGNGTLQLTGNNSFGNVITVNGGVVRASISTGSNGLGSAAVTLNNGTTLQLDPTASTSTPGLTGRTLIGAVANNVVAPRDFSIPAIDVRTYFGTGNVDTGNVTTPFYTGGPIDSFSIQWTGKLNVSASGNYSFFTSSDDASRIFVDGQLVANDDGSHGNSGGDVGGAPILLSPGLHDIRIDMTEGSGNNAETARWQGPGFTKTLLTSANVFASETSSSTGATNNVQIGNVVAVNGNATINLNGSSFTGVTIGGLQPSAGSTLSVVGGAGKQLRSAGTFFSGGTATINTTPDVALGQLVDNGTAVTLVKQGTGRLVLDTTGSVGAGSSMLSTSTIDVQGGKLVLIGGVAGSDPAGAAKIQLNGGGMVLDTKGATASGGGTTTFDNPVNVLQNSTIEVVPGSGIVGGVQLPIALGSASNGVTLATGTSLTLDVYGGSRSATGLANNFFGNQVTANGANLVVNGPISGTNASVTIQSTQFNAALGGAQMPSVGSVTMTAANTYSGATTLKGQVYNTPNVLGAGLVSAASTSSFPITLTLSGNGTLLNTSGISFTDARLTLDASGTNNGNRISDTLPIALNNSVVQFIGNTTAASGETFGALTVNSGFNAVTMSGTATGLSTTLTGSSLARANRAQIAFQGSSLGTQATASNLVKFGTAPTAQLVGGGGTIGGTAKNVSILPYGVGTTNTSGTITWTFVGYDGNNGIRPLSTGEFEASSGTTTSANVRDAFTAAATITARAGAINSWILDDTSTSGGPHLQTLSGTATITSGALMFTSSSGTPQALSLTAGTVAFGSTEGIISVMTNPGATIASAITGSAGLTVGGTGQLTINGDNSAGLTGAITVNGQLAIGADNSLGAGANQINMNGGMLKFGAAITSARTVNLLAGTISGFDTSANAGTLSGPVTGGGSLVKIGGNTLTLTNAGNNYTGLTEVEGGTLQTTTGPTGNILNNGAVVFSQSGSGTYAGNITGAGSLTVTASGQTITLGDPNNAAAGVNNYTGGTTVSASTTLRGTTSSLQNGIVTNAGSALIYEQSFNGSSTVIASGPAPVLKLGTGAVTLLNASSYTGSTTISGGSLIAGTNAPNAANGAFGNASSAVVLGDAATTTNNSSPGVFTGGAFTIARPISIANQATTGIYSLGGAADATSTFSGAISVSQPVTVSQVATSSGNTLNITGGISSAAGNNTATFAGPGSINVNTVGITDGVGTMAVNVTGGESTFAAANTYSGATTVSGGTLIVNGSITGNVTLTGGTLKGIGSIGGSLVATLGGTISPGSSPGVLTTSTLLMGSGGTLNVELNSNGSGSPVAGVDFDQLKITGNSVDLGGSTLSLAVGNIVPGDVFTIILNNGTDADPGVFNGLANGSNFSVGPNTFKISYFDNPATISQELAGGSSVSVLVVVPEPGTGGAAVAGLALAAGLRRFRRRSEAKA